MWRWRKEYIHLTGRQWAPWKQVPQLWAKMGINKMMKGEPTIKVFKRQPGLEIIPLYNWGILKKNQRNGCEWGETGKREYKGSVLI